MTTKRPAPEMLTKHFSRQEFACPCCGRAEVSIQIASACESIRGLIGVPIKITSGYRCPAHNVRVGGVRDSWHVKGLAADITSQAGVRAIYEAALRVPAIGGIGLDFERGFAHIDVRPHPARWGYRVGKQVSIESVLS